MTTRDSSPAGDSASGDSVRDVSTDASPLVADLQARVKKLELRPKDVWDKLQVVAPLVTGAALALVGYFLTGSVNLALQERQLQLSNVKEMRELLATLQRPTATTEEAQAAALTLSAFGGPAIPPLLTGLSTKGLHSTAAVDALRAIGLTEPHAVCDPLGRMLDNRSGRFSWLTHLALIRLIGDLECVGARPSIARFERLLAPVAGPNEIRKLQALFDASPPIDSDSVDQLKRALDVTRTKLEER